MDQWSFTYSNERVAFINEQMKFQPFYVLYGLNWLRQVLLKKQRNPTQIREGNMADNPLEWIFARRSIRKFHSNPVEDEKIDLMLQAAMAAPSANNAKPWHFIVVKDRQTLNRLAEIHPYAKMCYEATLAIVVCADPAISKNYWQQDCSAATQNVLLVGTSLGLGTVWLGVHPRLERRALIKKLFSVPDDMEVLSIVAVGYPAEKKQSRTQFDSGRVHHEAW
ncbi:Bifunctional F420 biosynthesis protein FbiB [subsurface metagenome]